MEAPRCPSCGCAASLMRKGEVLTGRPGPLWVCLKMSCEAWIGCQPGTEIPLGPLADAVARRAAEMWRRA